MAGRSVAWTTFTYNVWVLKSYLEKRKLRVFFGRWMFVGGEIPTSPIPQGQSPLKAEKSKKSVQSVERKPRPGQQTGLDVGHVCGDVGIGQSLRLLVSEESQSYNISASDC